MTKQEFKDFCHQEFVNRGFKKKRSMYYLKGKDLLCGLYLQKSMAEAYYVEYDFFIGEYENEKEYPTTYDADIYKRFTVLSKDTYQGEYFMDACIEYELYTKEEIKPYFDKEFEAHIMPIIRQGKDRLRQDLEHYLNVLFEKEKANVLEKLRV